MCPEANTASRFIRRNILGDEEGRQISKPRRINEDHLANRIDKVRIPRILE